MECGDKLTKALVCGKLRPEVVDENTGYRYYTERQLKEFYGEVSNKERLVVGYCRVSSAKQKEA